MKRLLLFVTILILSLNLYAQDKKIWAKSFINQKAPEFVVEKWISEKPETKGKYLLIDFWATWCGPCIKTIPKLNDFQNKFGDKLVVIGVSDEEKIKVKKVTKQKMRYFSAIDTKKRMYSELEIKGIPHCIIINPEGVVVWEGFPLLTGNELTEEVVASIVGN
jgi:thiol-disulfide isomerase/thioredoxin